MLIPEEWTQDPGSGATSLGGWYCWYVSSVQLSVVVPFRPDSWKPILPIFVLLRARHFGRHPWHIQSPPFLLAILCSFWAYWECLRFSFQNSLFCLLIQASSKRRINPVKFPQYLYEIPIYLPPRSQNSSFCHSAWLQYIFDNGKSWLLAGTWYFNKNVPLLLSSFYEQWCKS